MQKGGPNMNKNYYKCEYEELARNTSTLSESAKISRCDPNSNYKIFIAKLFKSNNGTILHQSNREGPIDVQTRQKSDGSCYNEQTVSVILYA